MSKSRWMLILGAVTAASLALNLFLMTRPAVPQPARSEPDRVLARGTQLEDLLGRNELGDRVRVQLVGAERPTLLYVVTPNCVWCKRNRNNFLKVVRERGGEYNVVLLSLTDIGLAEHVRRIKPLWEGIDVQVLTGLSADTKNRMMLGSSPQTIVVAVDGRIVQNWLGAYTKNTLIGVENFFLVQLPGLISDDALEDYAKPS